MEKIPGIYVIGDLDTGISYLGSSAHIPKRLYEHDRGLKRGDHSNWRLQKAFNDGNRLVVTQIPTKPEEDILAIEQTLLDEFHPTGQLYNIMRDVAPTCVGVERTEETKRRIGEASAKKFEDPEYLESHRDKLKQFYAVPENRERLAELNRKNSLDPEFKVKQAEKANEQWSDPEARLRKSEEVKARYASDPEDRQKRIDARAHLCKPVSVNGTVYPSLGKAAEAADTTRAHVLAKIKSKHQPGWYYVNKEE